MTKPHIVTPEEAQGWLPELVAEYPGTRAHRCVHTVVVQAEQIAAVLALCDQQDRMHATVSTDRVRRALGVTA